VGTFSAAGRLKAGTAEGEVDGFEGVLKVETTSCCCQGAVAEATLELHLADTRGTARKTPARIILAAVEVGMCDNSEVKYRQ